VVQLGGITLQHQEDQQVMSIQQQDIDHPITQHRVVDTSCRRHTDSQSRRDVPLFTRGHHYHR